MVNVLQNPLPIQPGNAASLPAAVAEPMARSWSEAEAYAYCSALTRRHYENFPVGSFLIPRSVQPAIHSLYAFMRTADDFADEDRSAGDEAERLSYLETWNQMLVDCQTGRAKHPIFIALGTTIRQFNLPMSWLHDLLHAFKMDVTVRRYATSAELFTYCRYSANPVGRLILTLFGYRQETLYELSDRICTALQLANHWQDIAVDLKKARIYLPKEDLKRFGVSEEWLFKQAGVIPAKAGIQKATPRPGSPLTARGDDDPEWIDFRRLMGFEVDRAHRLFEEGRSLPERVRGRLRWELRMTWLGGWRVLGKIQAVHYDVFTRRPTVTHWDWMGLGLRALRPYA